ncbi:MAG: nucleotidyltransferase domain-containing protein [Pseudomonadota bacterium]|nr:nucleotidyltransferase domain-containing protein [Pseudomonadota bacterium]
MGQFGLSDQVLADLHREISRFPEVKTVLIYGSRATGEFKPWSDIDLAVVSPDITTERYTALWSALDGLPLAFGLDVLHQDKLQNPRLRERIERTGRELYPAVTEDAAVKLIGTMSFGSLRDEIYARFHDPLDRRFSETMSKDDKRHAKYYTAMYLMQDSYESTDKIAGSGFSENPFRGYVEVWGYLQAIFISQDALKALYEAIVGDELNTDELAHWRTVRELRNEIAGHPADRMGRVRSFFGREQHDIERFHYERFDAGTMQRTHPGIDLKQMRHDYFERDGAAVLRDIIAHIDTRIRT